MKTPAIFKDAVGSKLFRNSSYLILSSMVVSGFGFLFWLICARLYSIEEVGLGTTLISAMGLLITLSGFGFNIAILRYLPRSKDKNRKINSVFSVVALLSLLFATIFVFGVGYFSPELLFLKRNMYLGILFILGVIIAHIFRLIDPVFVAYDKSSMVLWKNIIFSLLKLILPVFLVSLGAFGIFGSYVIAAFVGLLFGIVILIVRLFFKPSPAIYDSVIKKIFGFSFMNYISNVCNQVPGLLMPLIIISIISPEATAKYYISFMMASLLLFIPNSVQQNIITRSSYNMKKRREIFVRGLKFTFALIIPGVIVLIFLGKNLLELFGSTYSADGYTLLVYFALSAPVSSLRILYVGWLNVNHKLGQLLIVNVVSASVILLFSILFINHGLKFLGLAYLLGQLSFVPFWAIFKLKK